MLGREAENLDFGELSEYARCPFTSARAKEHGTKHALHAQTVLKYGEVV